MFKEQEIEARLSKLEDMIAALQRSVDGMAGEARGTASPGTQRGRRPAYSSASESAQPPIAPRPRSARNDFGATMPDWFSSRTPEWWLSRLGAGFVVLAILFLYGYAVDNGWITPPVRVLAGVIVGGALFWAGYRIVRPTTAEESDLGMKELLYGGGLAIWYVTAYAASVWYQLISVPTARLLFFALAILSTWIALQERREIFAFFAVVAGFATPFILPAPVTSLTEVTLYLSAVAGMGLIIYLMRGWPATLWITFVAYWVSIAVAIFQRGTVHPAAVGSVGISFLLVVAGAAFTRTPSLRRRLLTLGSDRYTPAPATAAATELMKSLDSLSKMLSGGKSATDSLILWVLTLLSPILTIGLLAAIWTAPAELWGVVFIALAVAAFYLARTIAGDGELQQVAFTGAALWSLLGILKIAPAPEALALTALHATGVIVYAGKRFIGARALAKLTIVLALAVVVGGELSPTKAGLLRWRWVMSELVALAASGVITTRLITDPAEEIQGAILAALSYFTALLLIANVLKPIWAPLVTTTYAIFGATLLILSRKRGRVPLMRQLGGATMVIVVVRLLLVDLATVETIWRVLLFLVCGVLFLYTGYRLQPSRGAERGK